MELKTATQNTGMLTDSEVEAVVMAALDTGEKTDDQLYEIIEWAKDAKLKSIFLDWITQGRLALDYTTEVVFHKTSKT